MAPEVGPKQDQSARREPVRLDAAVYRPADAGKHPTVLLAHGFGGSRADSDEAARELAAHGYLAVAYSARGFGASEGLVHLDDPDVEVADARAVITAIAQRDDVQLDAPGDPRVGVSGASYGGALALMLAGSDPRVDAVVAAATWNDLASAFYPSSLVGVDTTPAALDPDAVPGVLKRRWLSGFFSGVAAPRVDSGDSDPSAPPANRPSATPTDPAATPCGRFEPTLCAQFLSAGASTRPPPAALVSELHRRSPAVTNERVTAPTLLVQGLQDSLFGLDHADANARQIAAAGTPVAVRWFEGGHDGGAVPSSAETLLPWFDRYLRDDSANAGEPESERRRRALPVSGFTTTAPAFRRGATPRVIDAPRYPGLSAIGASPEAASTGLEREPRSFADAPTGTLLSPPGGDPAATVTLPGLGRSMDGAPASAGPMSGGAASSATVVDPLSAAAYALAALPGQSVAFDALPGETSLTVVGAPRVRLTVTSSATDATFFVSMWKVVAGTPSSPRRLVAPVRVATRPGVPTTVDVALPAGTYTMEQGSTWRILVSATDAAYATPTDARVYRVALAGSDLLLPVVPSAKEVAPPPDGETRAVVTALLVAVLTVAAAGLAAWTRGRRRDAAGTREDLANVPLTVEHLVKTYADGHRAVDDVSWAAQRGQVVGLLGPNGAGKTTTIRMIAGLIRPDSGEAHVYGRPLRPGSPALAEVGTLIEGPGFLPHLTGRENLRAYWAATGRPADEANLDEALGIAALGNAIERPVRSYSHGMKQRLGIAQAMLGMPDVLILDEPTNGLDPPQIAAMRPVLREYARSGRTVVVSSHLLAEVEMTCSHVVVMHRGRVVSAGAVADLVESSDTTVVELGGDTAAARRVAGALRAGSRRRFRRAEGLTGLRSVQVDANAEPLRMIVVADAPRADVVAAVVAAELNAHEFNAQDDAHDVLVAPRLAGGGSPPGGPAPDVLVVRAIAGAAGRSGRRVRARR